MSHIPPSRVCAGLCQSPEPDLGSFVKFFPIFFFFFFRSPELLWV